MNKETIFIGPCKCGGYGQCFDEETEAELGVCHRRCGEGGVMMRTLKELNEAQQVQANINNKWVPARPITG